MKTRTRICMMACMMFCLTGSAFADWQSTNGPFGGEIHSIAFIGTNTFVATVGGGVYLSTNNDIEALAESGTKLFAGSSNNGVYMSTDNGTGWNAVNSGLTSLGITSLLVKGSDLFAGTTDGVFRTTNEGVNWSAVSNELTSTNVQALIVKGSSLFAGTNGGGSHWVDASNGLPGGFDIFSLAFHGNALYATLYGGGVHVSTTNGGTSWIEANNGIDKENVLCFALNGSRLFAGTNGHGVYVSTNNGLTSTRVYSLYAAGSSVFAATDGGVFASTNNGSNWTASSTGIGNVRTESILQSNGVLFAAVANDAVYRSTDQGATWQSTNTTGMPTVLNCLGVHGSALYAGTNCGVWKRPLSDFTDVEETAVAYGPRGLALKPNYPNPFNPVTTISYSVATPARISMKIFDIRGTEVSTLVSGKLQPGEYKVTWNASTLPGGVYVCRLEADGMILTRKLRADEMTDGLECAIGDGAWKDIRKRVPVDGFSAWIIHGLRPCMILYFNEGGMR